MILHIPVRRRTIKDANGATSSILELANGFVSVTVDSDSSGQNAGVGNGRLQISNPLTEFGIDMYNRGFIGITERIQIELEELPFSNPAQDDESTSLVHLDQIV